MVAGARSRLPVCRLHLCQGPRWIRCRLGRQRRAGGGIEAQLPQHVQVVRRSARLRPSPASPRPAPASPGPADGGARRRQHFGATDAIARTGRRCARSPAPGRSAAVMRARPPPACSSPSMRAQHAASCRDTSRTSSGRSSASALGQVDPQAAGGLVAPVLQPARHRGDELGRPHRLGGHVDAAGHAVGVDGGQRQGHRLFVDRQRTGGYGWPMTASALAGSSGPPACSCTRSGQSRCSWRPSGVLHRIRGQGHTALRQRPA